MTPTPDQRLPPAPDRIDPAEELGRSVYSRRPTYRAFLERLGVSDLSVDRLTYAPPDFAVTSADDAARTRNRTFYGWLIITADGVTDNGCRVQASPLPDGANPYHADIILPESAAANPDEQARYAQILFDAAQWRPRPNYPVPSPANG